MCNLHVHYSATIVKNQHLAMLIATCRKLATICLLISTMTGKSIGKLLQTPTINSWQAEGKSSSPLPGQDCSSPWKYYNNGSCKCGKSPTSHQVIDCDDHSNKNVSVLNSFCMTYDEQAYITEVGPCVYYRVNICLGLLQYLA
jgi:hypothetical protein